MPGNRSWIHPFSDWSSHREEVANCVTHALGFILSVIGAVVLIGTAFRMGDGWRLIGCGIYSFSLVLLYAMSTLSHLYKNPIRRSFFRTLDQGSIYLLIVGTYTPFSLAFLRSAPWSLFLAVMWAIAIGGFLSKTLLAHRVDAVLIWIYVVLGWMPIVTAPVLVGIVPAIALWWMLFGGLFYTIGTVFLFLDHRVPHFHAVWHLMVMAGSLSHFFVILFYVAPSK